MIRAKLADAFRKAGSPSTIEGLAAVVSIDPKEVERLMKAEGPVPTLLELTPSQAVQLHELFLSIGVDFFSREAISKVRELEKRAGEMRSALDAKKK